MPRTAKPATPQPVVELNHEALNQAQAARDQLAVIDQTAQQNAVELAKFLGYDGPLQPELLEHGIAQQMRRTVDACLEMGKMLLLLKERVGHGHFEESLERLSLAPRAARKFMQSAYKFANRPLTAVLKDAIGSQTKLIELLVLDDEEVKGLVESDSVRGITVDEIASMSVSELRAALREAQEDVAAKDKLLESKNKKIDRLEAGKKFKPAADAIARTEEQQKQLDELVEATNGCEVRFMALANVVEAIEAGDSKAMRGRAAQAIQYMAQRLADIIDQHGIEVSLGEHIAQKPEWLGLTPTSATTDDAAKH